MENKFNVFRICAACFIGLGVEVADAAVLNPTFSFFYCPKPRLIEPAHRDGVDPADIGRTLKRPSRPATGGYCIGDTDSDDSTPWPNITRMLADDLPPCGDPIEPKWEEEATEKRS